MWVEAEAEADGKAEAGVSLTVSTSWQMLETNSPKEGRFNLAPT